MVITMTSFNELYQSADWKREKHAPVIEVQDMVRKGKIFNVSVTLGKQVIVISMVCGKIPEKSL